MPRRVVRHRFPALALSILLLITEAALLGGCRELPPAALSVPGSALAPESREAVGEFAAQPAMEWRRGAPVDLADLGGGDCLWRRGEALIPLPLLDLDVDIQVSGPMLRATLRQRFLNAAGEAIEAIYVFPLPERAALHAMELRIGDRHIVAEVKERIEARRRYEAARSEGRRAALVEQERPNLFTTSVANILQGEEVVVELVYIQELEFADGRFGLHFPLTFTPRYLPAGMRPTIVPAATGGEYAARDALTDAARITPPFRAPDAPGLPRARIRVSLAPGLPLRDLNSTSHAVQAFETGPRRWRVSTRESEVPADRDFRLEWRPDRTGGPASALFIEERESEAYALLMLLPPEADTVAPRPSDTLFVVDISGSMDGPSIQAARVALLTAMERMLPADRFAFLTFNHEQRLYAERFLPAEREDLGRARRWVERLSAQGGTEINAALVRALLFCSAAARAEPERFRRIVFITDGAVGNEAEVLATVAAALGETRIHTLGIGPTPNRYLLRELARLGRGSHLFIDEGPETAPRMREFLARFDRPLLMDLWLGWEGVTVEDVAPARLPDLHPGQALFVSARLASVAPAGAATLRAGKGLGQRLLLAEAERLPAGAGLALRWARAKVGSLMDGLHHGADPKSVRQEVLGLALEHQLVTRFTSLVAEERQVVMDAAGRALRLPNALPRGSTLLNGRLPRGGSNAPLRRLLALGFGALALALLAVHAGRRR